MLVMGLKVPLSVLHGFSVFCHHAFDLDRDKN